MILYSARLRHVLSAAASHPLSLYFVLCALLLADAIRVIAGVPAKTPAQIAFVRVDIIVATAATLILGGLGWAASRRRDVGSGLSFSIGAMAGLVFFARTLGFALADPDTIGWLMIGDWAQHYSGWAMFRSTPWNWPPGLMPEIWYPVGTSIVYTDSLPLLALLLKPFSAVLPQPFQYIGLWLLTSCVLQGGFGALLVSREARTPAAVLCAGAIFVFAPVLIDRIHHDTLTAQWLLLASFWLYFRAPPPQRFAAEAWPWWALTTTASLVHPYLAAMVLAVALGYAWKRRRDDVPLPKRAAFGLFASSLAVAAFCWWLCGAMIIRAGDSSGGVAYGLYSLNLLAFINPMHFSIFLPNLPARPEQHEGFAYLGAGLLALTAFALVEKMRGMRLAERPRDWKPLAVVAIALVAFAVSTVVSIGSWTPIDFPLKSRLLGLFRSSGRFVWVAYYALMLLVLSYVLRRFAPRLAAVVLAAVLAVQMIDLSAAHGRIARLRLTADAPVPRLDDPRWESVAAGRHHVTVLPPAACGGTAAYVPILLFAAERGLTANTGYLARWNARATGRYCEAVQAELESGSWSGDDLYIVGADWKPRFMAAAPAARCEPLNGYDVCVVDTTTP